MNSHPKHSILSSDAITWEEHSAIGFEILKESENWPNGVNRKREFASEKTQAEIQACIKRYLPLTDMLCDDLYKEILKNNGTLEGVEATIAYKEKKKEALSKKADDLFEKFKRLEEEMRKADNDHKITKLEIENLAQEIKTQEESMSDLKSDGNDYKAA